MDPVPNLPLREVAEDLRKAKWWGLGKEEREELEKRLEDVRRVWRRREREGRLQEQGGGDARGVEQGGGEEFYFRD